MTEYVTHARFDAGPVDDSQRWVHEGNRKNPEWENYPLTMGGPGRLMFDKADTNRDTVATLEEIRDHILNVTKATPDYRFNIDDQRTYTELAEVMDDTSFFYEYRGDRTSTFMHLGR